jgi:hypothetical protein
VAGRPRVIGLEEETMRSWISLTLALAVLGGTVARVEAATPAEDMVRSGCFEQEEKPGIGRDWASESYGANTIRFDLAAAAQSGKFSQHILVEGHEDGGAQLRQLGMKLAKGQRYEISLWMRGTVAAPVTVGFRKATKPYTYYVKDTLKVTSAWQRFTVSGIAGEDDDNAGLYIFFAGNGDLWIDSVSAKPMAAAQEVAVKSATP